MLIVLNTNSFNVSVAEDSWASSVNVSSNYSCTSMGTWSKDKSNI